MVQSEDSPAFSSSARWIWGADDAHPTSVWRCFRRSFVSNEPVICATLLVTADSAYECHLNGSFLGRGPVRSYPFEYSYAPGYAKIRIAPQPWHLKWARDVVPTPRGPVTVAWQVDGDGRLTIEYSAPPGCEVEVVN